MMTTLFEGKTADGSWRAEVKAVGWGQQTRYVVERFERVYPSGDNARWEPRHGAEGFPTFADAAQANVEARTWIERHENR